jgi:DeoR family transcriptional regulator of aga operon
MLSEERQRAILETLDRDGRVLVVDLAKHFQTSAVTIRKDLGVLHAKGRIQRTRDGALRVLEDPALQEKEKLHRKEKLQIAASAARMVEAGQVVILDSGTTTTAIARAMRNLQNVTIITNAVNIAVELCEMPETCEFGSLLTSRDGALPRQCRRIFSDVLRRFVGWYQISHVTLHHRCRAL